VELRVAQLERVVERIRSDIVAFGKLQRELAVGAVVEKAAVDREPDGAGGVPALIVLSSVDGSPEMPK